MASSVVNTVWPLARGMWHWLRISSNRSRSSAASTPSEEVPSRRTPMSVRALASLMAVCPPNCTTAPQGFSCSTMFWTSSAVRGSKYSLSATSKSVETVSGLLLMMMVSKPMRFRAHTEWTEQ